MYAIDDVASALKSAQSLGYLAVKKLQLEYRRSIIGSLWIVIAFVITATGIGVLLAELTGRQMSQHVPHVLFGMAAWNFVNNIVTSGCNVFHANRSMILQVPLPRATFVITQVFRHGTLFLVQLATAVVVAALFGWRPGIESFYVLPAIVVFAVAGFGVTFLVAFLTLRLPDIGEIIASVMRLAFFFTPIIWVFETRTARFEVASGESSLMAFLVRWNPFTHFIEIVRSPLMYDGASVLNWIVAVGLAAALFILGMISLQIAGRRLAYWL
ncbi:ABC transporter permease [Maricaulis sp.]|uniref:ABC transporter permease n=1 Tax=Maricaulis sp. TaxID=1486257 RepID=UPI002636FE37|nr:ABC transporter permease [Maricaulis sp.]MDF1769370.1 ABC transporter permease [Maricaulis sp.]